MNLNEQKARDLLEQCGVDDVPAGDVMALANYRIVRPDGTEIPYRNDSTRRAARLSGER